MCHNEQERVRLRDRLFFWGDGSANVRSIL